MSSTTLDSVHASDVPSFNVNDPNFSITADEVHEARERSWYATTPYGIAVLRYEQVNKLIKHPKMRQGSIAWPAHNGITEGPFAQWWASWILNKEGEEHHRLRRLLNPAFSPKLIAAMRPQFQQLANELIDNFAEPDRCEFVGEFAEPYAARVIAQLLGLPESEWPVIARESATIGLAMGVTIREDLPKIEAALARLFEYVDAAIADRKANPRDDFMTALVNASNPEDGRLSHEELRNSAVLLIFGGFDTTRNQLGLALQTFMKHPDQWCRPS
jgi:Cytochrome P450